METIYQNLPSIIGTILTTIVSIIAVNVRKVLEEQKREQEIRALEAVAVREGIVGLLRFRMDRIFKAAEHNGYISSEDLNIFEGLYKPYKTLGGNGIVETHHQRLLTMPLQEAVR